MKRLFLTLLVMIVLPIMGCAGDEIEENSTMLVVNMPNDTREALFYNRYSVCIEAVDPNDESCSPGALYQSTASQTSVNFTLNPNCSAGYKLKTWLWHEDYAGNVRVTYGLDDKYRTDLNTYKDGYLMINDVNKAARNLQLQLLPVEGGFSTGSLKIGTDSISINPQYAPRNLVSFDTDCPVVKKIRLGGFGNRSTVLLSSSRVPNTIETIKTAANVPFDTSVNIPTGELIFNGAALPELRTGYPYLILYYLTDCQSCAYVKERLEAIQSQLEGKIHVYIVQDVTSTFMSTTTVFPYIEFFNRALDYVGYINGAYWTDIDAVIRKLTTTANN